MKVLFVGYHNPNFVTITEYIEQAFESEGYQCLPFDDRRFFLPGRMRSIAPPFQYWDIKRINIKLIKLAERTKPDLVLVSGGHRILGATVTRLKQMNIKTALWTIDPPADFETIIETAPLYDEVFCGGTEAIEILEENNVFGCTWLPFAMDDHQQYLVNCNDDEKEKYTSDIVFVGSFYPNRLKVLEQLADFDINVWGPGWEKVPEDSPLKGKVKVSQLKSEEWMKIYQSAKIVIIIHYQDGETPCYQASPKVYEALASGSFVICDDQKDVKALFDEEKDLVIFKDAEDLKNKIDYYLEHDKQRENIAKNGKGAVLKSHTYRHRVRTMADIIK